MSRERDNAFFCGGQRQTSEVARVDAHAKSTDLARFIVLRLVPLRGTQPRSSPGRANKAGFARGFGVGFWDMFEAIKVQLTAVGEKLTHLRRFL